MMPGDCGAGGAGDTEVLMSVTGALIMATQLLNIETTLLVVVLAAMLFDDSGKGSR